MRWLIASHGKAHGVQSSTLEYLVSKHILSSGAATLSYKIYLEVVGWGRLHLRNMQVIAVTGMSLKMKT